MLSAKIISDEKTSMLSEVGENSTTSRRTFLVQAGMALGGLMTLPMLEGCGGSVPGPPSNGNLPTLVWPKFRGDAQNTGRGGGSGATGSHKWDFSDLSTSGTSTTGGFLSSPSIGPDGTVYIGASNGKLYALYGPAAAPFGLEGKKKWEYQTGGPISWSSPAISTDGTIYIGSSDKKLHALTYSQQGITQKWVFPTNGAIQSSPAIGSDGKIYIASTDGFLYALIDHGCTNVSNQWKFQADSPITSSPAIIPYTAQNGQEQQIIYLKSSNGTLYIILDEGLTFLQLAAYPLGASGGSNGIIFDNSPSIGPDGTIYVAGSDRLHAFSKSGNSHTPKWNFVFGSTSGWSSPAIGLDGTIYVADETRLYALRDNGTNFDMRLYQPGGFITSSPVIGSDGTIYLGGSSTLYALKFSGFLPVNSWQSLWSVGLNGSNSLSPAIGADGTIYMPNIDGTLQAFNRP
jgi:outer membrane protein assembly factor BamB